MMLLLVMMTMMMTILIKICLFGTLLDSYLFNPFLRCRNRYEMNIFNIIHHCYNQSRLPRTIIRIDSIMHFKATIPSLSIHLYDSIISKLQFHHIHLYVFALLNLNYSNHTLGWRDGIMYTYLSTISLY